MDLKVGEQLNIQISYKILKLELAYVHFFFLKFELAFKGGYFLVVFMKNSADRLGIKEN